MKLYLLTVFSFLSLIPITGISKWNKFEAIIRNDIEPKIFWEGDTFKVKEELNEIVIEGAIKDGDLIKLIRTININGPKYRTISLASPGGKVLEAIKMGHLIRELKFKTSVDAIPLPEGLKCPGANLKDPSNCKCESACALIYVSGVSRHAARIGIHRPHLLKSDLINLSGDQAMKAQKEINTAVSEYLKFMGVPNDIRDVMFNTNSESMTHLEREQLSPIKGDINEYQEWEIAHCGSMDRAISKYEELKREMTKINSNVSPAKLKKLSDDTVGTYSECTIDLHEKLVLDSINDTLSKWTKNISNEKGLKYRETPTE